MSFSDGRNDLPTAIRAPPPPRVAHSTPLGLLCLGTHAFFCRAAGSVVAPGLAFSPRPSGACSEGVCMGLGGFPVPRRKTHRRGAFSKVCERVPQSTASVESICCCSADLSYSRPKQIDGLGPVESKNRSPLTEIFVKRPPIDSTRLVARRRAVVSACRCPRLLLSADAPPRPVDSRLT